MTSILVTNSQSNAGFRRFSSFRFLSWHHTMFSMKKSLLWLGLYLLFVFFFFFPRIHQSTSAFSSSLSARSPSSFLHLVNLHHHHRRHHQHHYHRHHYCQSIMTYCVYRCKDFHPDSFPPTHSITRPTLVHHFTGNP